MRYHLLGVLCWLYPVGYPRIYIYPNNLPCRLQVLCRTMHQLALELRRPGSGGSPSEACALFRSEAVLQAHKCRGGLTIYETRIEWVPFCSGM